MKNYSILSILLLTSFLFTNCEKEEPEAKNYIGIWKSTESGLGFVFYNTMTLTESSYHMYTTLVDSVVGLEEIPMHTRKGTLKAVGDTLFITITEIGEAEMDYETDEYGPIIYYRAGSEKFDNYIGEDATTKVHYSTTDYNKMTFKINDDEGEDIIYFTRQE